MNRYVSSHDRCRTLSSNSTDRHDCRRAACKTTAVTRPLSNVVYVVADFCRLSRPECVTVITSCRPCTDLLLSILCRPSQLWNFTRSRCAEPTRVCWALFVESNPVAATIWPPGSVVVALSGGSVGSVGDGACRQRRLIFTATLIHILFTRLGLDRHTSFEVKIVAKQNQSTHDLCSDANRITIMQPTFT